MRSTRHATAYGISDRGECAECGASVILRLLDGYVRAHGGCSGGGKPPAKVKSTEDLPLPD